MAEQIPIATYGREVLRKKAKKIKKIDETIIEMIDNMFYTMHEADGVGLSAPQVNKSLQLAVIDISPVEDYKDFKPLIIINPEIIEKHGDSTYKEGCLSFPGVRGEVKRPEKIFLKYNDIYMNEITKEFDKLASRVIQHEIDHLHGKLFIDYLPDDILAQLKLQLKNIKNRKTQVSYPVMK